MFLKELDSKLKQMFFIEWSVLLTMIDGDIKKSFVKSLREKIPDELQKDLDELKEEDLYVFISEYSFLSSINENERIIGEKYRFDFINAVSSTVISKLYDFTLKSYCLEPEKFFKSTSDYLKLANNEGSSEFEQLDEDSEVSNGGNTPGFSVAIEILASSFWSPLYRSDSVFPKASEYSNGVGEDKKFPSIAGAILYLLPNCIQAYAKDETVKSDIINSIMNEGGNLLSFSQNNMMLEIMKFPQVRLDLLSNVAAVLFDSKKYDVEFLLTEKEKNIMLFEWVKLVCNDGDFNELRKSLLSKMCEILEVDKKYLDKFFELAYKLSDTNNQLITIVDQSDLSKKYDKKEIKIVNETKVAEE